MKVREVSGTEPYELSPHGHAFINPYHLYRAVLPFRLFVRPLQELLPLLHLLLPKAQV